MEKRPDHEPEHPERHRARNRHPHHHGGPGDFFGLDVEKMSPKAQDAVREHKDQG